MNESRILEALQKQYLILERHQDDLMAACANKEQRQQVFKIYDTARKSYFKAIQLDFEVSNAQIEDLNTAVIMANLKLEESIQHSINIVKVLELARDALTLSMRFIESALPKEAYGVELLQKETEKRLVEPEPPMRGTDSTMRTIKLGDQTAMKRSQTSIMTMPEDLLPTPSPRYFNLLFTESDGQSVVPREKPLIYGQTYNLLINIDPERQGIGEDDVTFPDQVLDRCWDDQNPLPLTVWASSKDFQIEPAVCTLNLPRQGPSEGVRFLVRPQVVHIRGLIQVDLYYRGQLLQSKQVDAYIAAGAEVEVPASLQPPQTARTTFTTTACLDPKDLRLLPERVLTVAVERDPRDGNIDFRFLDRTRGDEELAYYNTRLQPEGLGKAIAGVRTQLKLTVTGGMRHGTKIEGFLSGAWGDDNRLNNWLPPLAGAGRFLYRALLPGTGTQPADEDRGERLRAALQPGAIIQVNPVVGVVTAPWALLYERELKLVEGQTKVCERFASCGPDCADCPYPKDPYVVCPFAFWGFRYAIEQLPCWVSKEATQPQTLPRKIGNGETLYLNFNVWRDFRYWQEHLRIIESFGQVKTLKAEKVQELEQVWLDYSSNLDVVYFYCHGGKDEVLGQSYLELSDGGRVDGNFLEASHLLWPHSPLVFLNGCATGDYGPESYISLIDDFRTAGASGVVGTECPVSEPFAVAFAAAIFPRFFRGESLGQAMLAERLEFLRQKKNPLGLIYTLYAAHDITLANPVRSINL